MSPATKCLALNVAVNVNASLNLVALASTPETSICQHVEYAYHVMFLLKFDKTWLVLMSEPLVFLLESNLPIFTAVHEEIVLFFDHVKKMVSREIYWAERVV